MAKKARTMRRLINQVDVEFVQFNRDKKNKEEVKTFCQAVYEEKEKLYLDTKQTYPNSKEKLPIEIKGGDILAKYPSGYHVFPEHSFYENHTF